MKIKHPTIPGMTADVPDSKAADWLAQGWLPADSPRRRRPKKASPATE